MPFDLSDLFNLSNPFSLANPLALLLLGLLPLFWWISRGRLRYMAQWRRRLIIAVRLSLLTLLILALAGLQLNRSSNSLSVVFLVDQSDSMGPSNQQAALDFVQTALAEMPATDTAGMVAFGANALVEEAPRPNLTLGNQLFSVPNRNYSNLAEAIRLGSALFPADSAKRLVLISDGYNNLGDARSAAQVAEASDIELSTLKLAGVGGPEVRLVDLQAPNRLSEGQNFSLGIVLESNVSTEVEVQVFADGQLLVQQAVSVSPGENTFPLNRVAGSSGFSTFQARIVPQDDSQGQNNRRDTFSLVEGPQQVLIINPSEDQAQVEPLVSALQANNVQLDVRPPSQMPRTALELSQYAAVMLVNVPAFDFSPSQLELLQVYVRDLGGGLVAIGGPESFGAGGYFQTPLEETLPVDMALRDEERLPGMSMLMVIDKSGSMDSAGSMNGGPRKIELAKEAINRALDLLTPLDRVGVVAFDGSAQWVVRPVSANQKASVRAQVGTIRADGGTDILAGLQAVAPAIRQEPSRIKHIVLLTDGGADQNGINQLVDELVADDVSLSVVAIGDGYATFLQDVAQRGNGRFHFARDANTIPQIFAQEAALAVRAYIVEEEFTPARQNDTARLLDGLTADGIPNLYGYIATSPKTTALGGSVALVSPQGDPILAYRQYGLGRSVAWTSDAWGQWASDWVAWSRYQQFWQRVIEWVTPELTEGRVETRTQFDPETGLTRLIAEARTEDGRYLNNLNLNGNLVSPDLATSTLNLEQVAPGLYETTLQPSEEGVYLLRLLGRDTAGTLAGADTGGFVVNYSPEYATETTEDNLMAQLAELGGGQALSIDEAAWVFENRLASVTAARPLWPLLLTLFVCLLPLDVALRRVMFGRAEVEKVRRKIAPYLPNFQRPQRPQAPAPSRSTASDLLSTLKQDEPDSPPQTAVPPSASSAPPISQTPPKPAEPLIIKKRPADSPKPPPKPSDSPGEEAQGGSTMSSLLRAKREARKNQDDKS